MWSQALLDIDKNVKPDILCDAKDMTSIEPASFDAVYCSHNLEHFYKHDVPSVLRGFVHVLKNGGFAEVHVPDMQKLFELAVDRDIDDVWYMAGQNPITFHDVMYGWGAQVSQGNHYYCHKTGFSEKSLAKALTRAGFATILTARDGAGNLQAFAFLGKPTRTQRKDLGI
jgi:ubiquinone/menaquinone biosynthesis C-methylase UbiE